MKKLYILGLLFFLSCGEKTVYKESSYVFQLPQKAIFVKTSKYPGGRFTVFFAPDSLSLNNCRDSIEFRTGAYVQIYVNITDVYVRSSQLIRNIGNNNFNIAVIPDSIFDYSFKNERKKYSYSLINIDTKEYHIVVDKLRIKKGDLYGGW